MTSWGFGALIAGVIWLIVAYNMPICIELDQKCTANIFMIAARKQHLWYGAFMAFIGVIFTLVGIVRAKIKKDSELPKK
ncbi:hypothetical protein GIX45_18000 [Erwinia sp. CPCC 100877]|nr:hypothetical protein [Erwinia sp. CPCC 100877]